MKARRYGRVCRCRRPGYPTKLSVLADPQLLARRQPAPWLSNRELVAATSALLALNATGCGRTGQPSRASLAPDAPAVVAPIFVHGDGRGSLGCIAVAPPSFLSEEEALQVMQEELERAGLDVRRPDAPVGSVHVPRRYITFENTRNGADFKETVVAAPEETADLAADFVDEQRHVAIKFVSFEHYRELGGPVYGRGCGSTVNRYDFRELGTYVAAHVAEHAQGVYWGTLYDPSVSFAQFVPWAQQSPPSPIEQILQSVKQSCDEREELVRAEAKKLLREQVKDFINWLKAQGAI